MHDYILYGAITLILSTVFSMGGAGSGIALIPVLHFLGLDFTVAKAVGLFAGASTTVTSSIMNIKHKAVEYAFVLPIAVTMLLFAPLGAYSSNFINENIVKFAFMLLLFYSATMMMFGKKKALFSAQSKLTLLLVGAVVGFIAGLLGVGGGNILIPLLALLGFAPKKVAVAVSFVVPFSALGSFFTYASYVPLGWVLLAVIALCAIIGGYIGNYLMHFKLEQSHIKKIMAALLYLLAFKMLWHLTFP
ncbi:sulfite exporter TauE/SafE family protein [Sulfurimonas sediminis]|uniref:Probable membrane transporter protein n=1 Tax=Sulfurimonas sediminis TaxID=2590020 RepID=A0A7M1B403_9BACT|nr:sulfite exporter TauE/SafE family protein [Sulfurimonas sediminis]QOP43422.1 sulfite exporter TauE/SafE family protein [Sulfurimonas sediminis]